MKRERASQQSAADPPTQGTILVVEDNPITLKLVQVTLRKEGYQVIAAADGKTALEQAAQQMPNLILQDLKLPDIDGIDLVRKLRALPGGDGIPIIAFTGFVTKVEEGIIANVGFTDFLIKPVEPSRLVAAIRTYLLPSQTLAERPGQDRRLLLVDDDPILLKYSHLQFTNAGFDVTTAHNGQEALDQARQQPPDIIVSDVLMPGMDGFQVCHAARQDPVLREVPVVLMSANYVEEADRKLAERIGASAYVYRSLGIKEILNAVVESLSRKAPVPTVRNDEEFEQERQARIVWQLDRMVNLRGGAMQRSHIQAAILNELSLMTETLTQRRDADSALQGILAYCLDGAGLSKGLLYLADDQGRLILHVQYGCDKLHPPAQNLFGQADLFASFLNAEYPVQVPSPALPDAAGQALLAQLESESALMIPVPRINGSRGLLALFSTSLNLVEEDWIAFGRSLAAQISQTIALSQTLIKLANSEQRYRQLVESTLVILWEFDAATWRVTYMAPQVEKILGYSAAAWLENGFWQSVIHPDDYESAARAITQAISTKKDYVIECRLRAADGRIVWIRSFASVATTVDTVTGLRGVFIDITAIKEAEQELRRYAEIVATTTDMLAFMDTDNRYVVVNEQYCKYFNLSRKQIIGRTPADLFRSSQFEEMIKPYSERCLQGESVRADGWLDYPGMGRRYMNMHYYPFREASGRITGMVTVARDITERRLAEDDLQLHLEQQAAIARLGQFALVRRNPATIEVEAVTILARILNVEYAKVLVKIPDRNELLLRAGVGWREGLVGHATVKIDKESQAGYTLISKQPVIIEDLNRETRFSESALLTEHGVVSGISVIIGHSDDPLGILGAHTAKRRKFTDDEIHFLEAIANILAESQLRFEKEQLLARAEQRFAHLINSSPSVIYTTSMDQSHRCNFVSDSIRDISGIEPDAMQNDPNLWCDHVHPEDRPRVLAEVEDLERRGGGLVEYRFRCKEDEYRWIRDNFRVVGNEIIGSWTDITEKKLKTVELERANTLLLASETRLSAIVRAALDAHITIDATGRITGWNPQAEVMFGWLAAEVLDRALADIIIPPGLRDAHRRGIERFIATGEGPVLNRQIEITALYRDGREFPVELTVAPIRLGDTWLFSAFVRDITARKQAELAVKESEERFRTVALASNDMIYEWDLGTNEFMWYGDAGVALGYGPGEFDHTFTGWENSIHPEDRARVLTAIERHLKDPSKLFSEEYRIRSKDGSYHFWTDRGMIVATADQKKKKWIGACTDVTERKLMELQLAQSQKMEAVGQLTGGVAHDFNNRLTVIIGNLELLERQWKDQPAALRWIRAALAAAEGGADLTRSLLSFSRKQVFETQVFNVNELLQTMHDLLLRVLGETIKIEVAPAADLWRVRTDRSMLENVLLNLTINARDAMPGGGVLTIETTNCTLDSDYIARHAYVNPSEYVLVAVSDTGTGMSEEVRRHAFEPFFTTKERGKGTGLGLSMAYGFAKQSGGHIEIYSEVGHGTSIKIYLPRYKKGAEEEAMTAPLAVTWRRDTLHGHKILMVEDDPAVLSITTAALTEMGCQVIAAENGPAALECFAREPDIVLLFTDVVMPGGMTGVELAQKLRAQRPGLRVLYTSGYAPQAAANHIAQAENDFWLAKPYHSRALREAVRRALGLEAEQ